MRGKTEPIRVVNFGRYELEGTMTVPGVFTAPIAGTTTFRIGWAGNTANFNFSLVANENGQQYNVYYDGMIVINMTNTVDDFPAAQAPDVITGRASVDDENGKKKTLGTFREVRRDQ